MAGVPPRLRFLLARTWRRVRPASTRGVSAASYRDALAAVFPPTEQPAGPAPIFLCAAGWRSGSTLLQRYVVSDPDVVLWGEPYGDLPILQHHVDVLRRLSMRRLGDLPTAAPDEITADEWIANAWPSLPTLGRSIRAQLEQLLATEVLATGHHRWGVKAVRWGGDEVELLRAAFPGARFVLLVRDPVAAYRSYSAHYPKVWFDRYPDRRVDDVGSFARHWSRLATDFAAQHGSDTLLVRLEDLVARAEEVADHLGIAPDRAVFDHRVRGKVEGPRELSGLERAQLLARTRRARSLHGY